MDFESMISHKSQIFTNHIRKNRISLPTLPSLEQSSSKKFETSISQIDKFPLKSMSHSKILILPQKTKELLAKQQRVDDLLKLKQTLNKRHQQKLQLIESQKPKQIVQCEMPQRIQQKMNQIITIDQKGYKFHKEKVKDKNFIQFQKCCLPIMRIHEICSITNDKRIYSKMEKMIETMQYKATLLKIINKLNNNGTIQQLYEKYRQKFIQNLNFNKDFKTLKFCLISIIETYQTNRNAFLTDSIEKKKKIVHKQKLIIGSKLQKIETFNIRKGIYDSLKKIKFQDIKSNRYFEELYEKFKNTEIY